MQKTQLVIFMLFSMLILAIWNTGYVSLNLENRGDPARRERKRGMNYGRRAPQRWFFTNSTNDIHRRKYDTYGVDTNGDVIYNRVCLS